MAQIPPQPLPVEEVPRYVQLLVWFFLAGFGGAVKYVSAVIRSPERVSNRRFLTLLAANSVVSTFCGLMGGLAVAGAGGTWPYLASGLFGYLGTQGLDYLLIALQKK